MPKVTEAHLEARRNQILDAAWTCFARKGYHLTTMQDICEESELSPGAIYRYFEGKQSILRATYDRYQQMARAVLDEARSQAAGPLDTLQVIGQTMWLSYFDDPMFETTTRVQIDTWPEIIRDEALLQSSREDLTFWRTVVTQLLTEAKKVGQVKADVDPASLAALLICAHEGLRHFRLVDPDNFEPERVLESILTLVSEKTPVETPRKRRSKASVQRK